MRLTFPDVELKNIDKQAGKNNGADEVIYFELNNGDAGSSYPDDEPFNTWLDDDCNLWFVDRKDWVKENKLCVTWSFVDMSVNFCISAAKDWVLENCPKLLTEYKQFIREPDKDGVVRGRFGVCFLPYVEENFGVICRLNREF